MEEAVKYLEEALNYLDKLESIVSRLKPGDVISAGLVYQLYELLMLTREKLVEARFKVVKEHSH
ncbi:MAG: hypothetical protein QW123_00915 [Desulfurococcaceae archaeon]|jgi:hypothetical protein